MQAAGALPCMGEDMSILFLVFETLSEAGVVHSGEEFSQKWCHRSPNWYANRKHEKAEFSVLAAINCNLVANLYLDVQTYRSDVHQKIEPCALQAVLEVRGLTERFLERRYRVAELAKTPISPLLSLQ